MAKKGTWELSPVPVGTNAGNPERALRSAHPGSNSEHRQDSFHLYSATQ